jgi:DHA1 family tetracycline resistance protein-like MFS transporter
VVITLIFVVVVVPLQAVGVLSSIGGAAAQSWMSRATGADEQGTVQGALTGIGAIAEMVVPVAASAAFAWSLTCSLPGLVFLGAGAFAAASTVLLAATPAAGSLRAPASITRPGGGERE